MTVEFLRNNVEDDHIHEFVISDGRDSCVNLEMNSVALESMFLT